MSDNRQQRRWSVRRLALAALALAAPLATSAAAQGYMTATGTAHVSVAVGSIAPPPGVTAQQNGSDVTVSWSAASRSDGGAVDGYTVTRSDGRTVCGGQTPVTGTSCTDSEVTSGTYTYTVSSVYRTFTGAVTSGRLRILTAPTIVAGPSRVSADGSPTFAFVGGGGSAYRCAIDGGSFAPCPIRDTLSGLSDGAHTFAVEASDGDSTGPTTTYSWTIDSGAPTITATPADPSAHASAGFSFSHNRSSYTFECRLDGAGFTACASPDTLSGLADGTHTFSVRAVSPDGAVTAIAAYTWRVDTTAPNATTTFPSSGSTYNASAWQSGCASAICGTASDGSGSGVQKVLISIRQGSGSYWNGSAFSATGEDRLTATGTTSWSYPIAASQLPDGTYTTRVYAVDNAGNIQTAATTTFTIDTTAPAIAITAVNGGGLGSILSLLTISSYGGTCSTAAGDASTVSWSVTGGASQSGTATCSSGSWTATLKPSISALGSYTLSARQTDKAGNTGTASKAARVI